MLTLVCPSSLLPINDSTEAVIQRKVEAIQRFTKVNPEADDSTLLINPATKRHFELEINILQNAPRDAEKLEQIIKTKERQREEGNSLHIKDMQRLVTEIEMLKVVLYLVNRNSSS